jgi:hypothetical protein
MLITVVQKKFSSKHIYGYFALCSQGVFSPFMCDTFYNIQRPLR